MMALSKIHGQAVSAALSSEGQSYARVVPHVFLLDLGGGLPPRLSPVFSGGLHA